MTILIWKMNATVAEAVLESVLLPFAPASLDEASLQLPGGAYTTFRTFTGGSQALRLGDHLARLEQTAGLAGKNQRLDWARVRSVLQSGINMARQAESLPGGEFRLRLTLDLEVHPGDLYLMIQPLEMLPALAYAQGVKVITCNLQRQLPKAKLTRFIARADPLRHALPPGVNEAIMVNSQGYLLEGLSSNFFAICSGVLWTAEEGVLSGVTRSLALQAASGLGLPVHLDALRLANIFDVNEAFITSASRGVLPVCQIDHVLLGSGEPGPVTRLIMQTFESLVRQQLEEIA